MKHSKLINRNRHVTKRITHRKIDYKISNYQVSVRQWAFNSAWEKVLHAKKNVLVLEGK